MYLRPLRTIFNEAIEDGIIKKEKCYPFGRRKYKIPASKNTKKALELNDIKRYSTINAIPKMKVNKKPVLLVIQLLWKWYESKRHCLS